MSAQAKFLFGFCLTIFCALTISTGILYKKHMLIGVPYEKISNNSNKLLIEKIALSTSTPNSETHTIFRLSDKKEQLFSGNWKSRLVDPTLMLVWGYPQESTNTQFLVETNAGSTLPLHMNTLPGPITEIVPNPGLTHFIIRGIRSNNSLPYTCVLPIKESDASHCIYLELLEKEKLAYASSTKYTYYWQPDEDNTLIIYAETTSTQKLYKTVPFHKVIDELPFDIKYQYTPPTPKQPPIKLVKYGPVYVATDTTRKKQYIIDLKQYSSYIPLTNEYILVKSNNETVLINVKTKEKSAFITLSTNEQLHSFYPEQNL